MSSHPHKKRLAPLVPALVALSACVHQSAPGVTVKALQSDIVFGLKIKKAAIPPLANPTPQDTSQAQPSQPDVPSQPPQQVFTPGPVATVPSKPAATCLPAAESAFPAQAATLGVYTPPKAGRYRWKETVNQPRGNGIVATITTFLEHDITNVSAVTTSPDPVPSTLGAVTGANTGMASTFTYDEVIHNLDGTTTTTTYEVKENAEEITQSQTVGGVINAGPPDRGVSLVRVVNNDATGKQTSTFNPTTPVLILPLDVVSSEQFQSVGVDPTGATLSINGTVGKRARVDACGTIIDGWGVTATQTFSDGGAAVGNAVPLTTSYDVGTQIGGLLTYEQKTLQSQFATSTTPTITDSIAQLNPDPIPAKK